MIGRRPKHANLTFEQPMIEPRRETRLPRTPLAFVLLWTACTVTQAGERDGWPPFSWDTVPVYIHFGKDAKPLTDDELKLVARTSNFVCLEKAHATGRFRSTERGIAHDARRLKELNPNIKVLFYWNTFLNYPCYDACDEIEEHPKWLFRDKDGELIYKTGRLEQYNLLDRDFRRWWASMAGKAVKQYGCDGIFMDATNQAKRPIWMKRGWGVGNEQLLTDAVIDMMNLANKEMGDDRILLFNGIRSADADGSTAGQEYMPYADGAMVEHFTAFNSRSKESIARDIESIRKAGKSGRLVVVKGWPDPDFTWLNAAKMKLPAEQLVGEATKKMTWSLACYLVAAEENCFFCYSWGYRERHGSLVDYPQFKRRLGRPQGDAARNGWTFSRSFEHADVSVDLSTRKARIDWK